MTTAGISPDDAAWLARRTIYFAADTPPRRDLADAVARTIVDPTRVRSGNGVVVGYPTGRHTSLVKAAEARLAVAQGAEEIWLAIDPLIADDPNRVLADIVAVREAVPSPVRLMVMGDVAEQARLAGANGIVAEDGAPGDVALLRRDADLNDVVRALDEGASQVALSDASMVAKLVQLGGLL